MRYQADLQREWINEQEDEHRAEQEQTKMEEAMYAMQTDTITRMRGMLEDEAAEKLRTMKGEVKDQNRQLNQQKKEAEQRWRNDQER